MIATIQDIQYLANNYMLTKYKSEIIIIDDCNFNCSHCGMKPHSKKILNIEYFKHFLEQINQLDHNFLIILYGGEPSLKLDLCKEINNLAKFNGHITAMTTNGWWINDENITNEIKKLELDYLALSVDNNHLQTLTLEKINKIIKEFQNSNIKLLGIDVIERKEYEQIIPEIGSLIKTKKHQFLELNCIIQEMVPINEECQYKDKKEPCYKPCFGLKLYPDGNVGYSCSYFSRSCKLNNILKLEVKKDFLFMKKTSLLNENMKLKDLFKIFGDKI